MSYTGTHPSSHKATPGRPRYCLPNTFNTRAPTERFPFLIPHALNGDHSPCGSDHLILRNKRSNELFLKYKDNR